MKGLSIGEVAKKSNVNIETIRYYERRGLISEPPRSESGYRIFPLETVERIKFIKRSQELGFSLNEIEKLLTITEDVEHFDSKEILDFTTQKIRDIELKIHDLEKMRFALEDLSAQCPGLGNLVCKCPIVETLSKGGGKNG